MISTSPHGRATPRYLVGIGIIAGASVLATGCGGSSKSASKADKSAAPVATVAPTAKTSTVPPPKVNKVDVTETESSLVLSVKMFKAGNYTFSVKNAGKAKSALTISGPGLENKPTSATLSPGQSSDLIVPLKKGTYQLWSPVGDAKSRGAATSITVP
jgi:hypothetical protein